MEKHYIDAKACVKEISM